MMKQALLDLKDWVASNPVKAGLIAAGIAIFLFGVFVGHKL